MSNFYDPINFSDSHTFSEPVSLPGVAGPSQALTNQPTNVIFSTNNPPFGVSSPSVSLTPNPGVSASPDFFSQIFGGLANGVGQAVPAFLNTAATNLANRITKTPTLSTTASGTSTTASALSNIPWGTLLTLGIGAIAVYFIVKKM
jgi:hypothetical protein